jgi:methyl-accepting chemotaxis protein
MTQSKTAKHKENVFWLTGVLFFVLLGSGIASIYFLFQLNDELKEVVEQEIPITEMITRITVHKLEQTYWFERGLRYAEIAARGQQDDKNNLRLLNEARTRFKDIAGKVNAEIKGASSMSVEARQRASDEHLAAALADIERSLSSIQEEYAIYVTRADNLFDLFAAGKSSEAERLVAEIEEREDEFNQRLEEFLFQSENVTRDALASIGEREGKAIIIIAVIISVALLFTVAALFFKAIYAVSRKVRFSRDGR